MSIVEDTERTRFCPQTDRRTRRNQPYNFVVGGVYIYILTIFCCCCILISEVTEICSHRCNQQYTSFLSNSGKKQTTSHYLNWGYNSLIYWCTYHGWPSTQPGTCTQPCPIVHTTVPHCSHSRAPGEQWARLCVFTLQGCVQAARLCRGSPVHMRHWALMGLSIGVPCRVCVCLQWNFYQSLNIFFRENTCVNVYETVPLCLDHRRVSMLKHIHKMRLIPGQNLQSWKKYSENIKTTTFIFMKLYIFDYTHGPIMLIQENRRIQENFGSGGWALMEGCILFQYTPRPPPPQWIHWTFSPEIYFWCYIER